MFVKPANLGSSIGISKVSDRIELESAIDLARQFDRKVLVEVAVPRARELECAVLGNDDPVASVPGEIIPAGEFYDYEAKYLHDDSTRIIPAILTVEQTAQIQTMALTAYHAIDCAGMARVDFLMDGTNDRLFLNELNTIPGFTTISMYSKMWAASGLEYPALLDRLIELACDRHAHTHALRTSEH
jgi:D-alanine-D-alanine ligase